MIEEITLTEEQAALGKKYETLIENQRRAAYFVKAGISDHDVHVFGMGDKSAFNEHSIRWLCEQAAEYHGSRRRNWKKYKDELVVARQNFAELELIPISTV